MTATRSALRRRVGGCREGCAAQTAVPSRGRRERARRAVEDGRRVAHRARHHVLGHETAHQVAVGGGGRVARPRRLQPDEAAARSRDPDGATPVVGVRGRDHARRHRGRRTARGPAGRVTGVPRVARRPEAVRLRGRQNAELGRVGLAADDEAGVDVALGQRLRGGRVVVAGEGQALAERRAGQLGAEVLQQEGHAAERAVGQRAGRLARARSKSSWITAFSSGLSLSMRAMAASTSSDGDDLLGADQLRLRRRVQPCRVVTHANAR